MPDFTYQALDRTGQATSGSISARDSADAALKVRSLGVFPTRIESGGGRAAANVTAAVAANREASAGGQKKINRNHILMFTRQMSDLLDAGLPMDRAFSVLIDQTDVEAIRAMLVLMQGDIRAGQPLSEALLRFPREFPPLFRNMVRAGEVSGQLAGVMTRLADFMEKEQVRRSQVMAAMTYPMVLMLVAILAVTFLLTFVIPKLSGVFTEMGSSLPLPTQILLGTSAFVQHYWWLIILTVVGIVFGARAYLATEGGRRTFDRTRIKAPLIGPLGLKIVAARFVRTLGTLLGGGVPILEALDISASAVGNMVASESIQEAHGGVRQGESLHEALGKSGVFPPVVTHMTAVGEETGRLPSMLLRTADTLDFEVDNAMRRLTSLVEPLVVLFMGGFVGFVVLSILMPIFAANSLAK